MTGSWAAMSPERLQNLYWTVGRLYERKYNGPSLPLSAAEEAMVDATFPSNGLYALLKPYGGSIHQGEVRTWLILFATEWTKEKLFSQRPGLRAREGAHYQNLARALEGTGERSAHDELLYAYARYRLGERGSQRVVLAPYMEEVGRLKNQEEFFSWVAAFLRGFFDPQKERGEQVDDAEKNLPDTAPKVPEKAPPAPSEVYFHEEIQAAEFTNVLNEGEDLTMVEEGGRKRAGDERQLRRRVSKHYGLHLPTFQLEGELARGLHQGMKLHLTRGVYGSDLDAQFFKEQVDQQEEKNRRHYESAAHIYRRQEANLKAYLKSNVLEDLDEGLGRSTRGAVDGGRVYRQILFDDHRVFRRLQPESTPQLTVDILLDMSASQRDHQEEVAIQGYILAQALTELKIPTRVLGFCNLFNYQILRLFRDYHDGLEKNQSIFRFRASGSNRDGFAYSYIGATLPRTEGIQVLIVLSDGRPNDHISVGRHAHAAQDYEGELAVEDSAREIEKLRLSGVATLGVFTGKEEDLSQEKIIFGNDFLYTRDRNRFSTLVGRYLKDVIGKMR
ncbi:MAG: hypothetical protein Q4E76_05095 [Tissierellia bacterium]|nr:hypothetical protein [Tissierellia bacterium]